MVDAQQKSLEAGQSLCNALRDFVEGYDTDHGRARTLMTKCWQSIQSRGTNNMNPEKDLEDMHSTARKVGWCEEEKTTKLWKQIEGDEQPRSHESQPQMEGIVYLLAEWISLTEMRALQSARMLVFVKAREKEYEEFLFSKVRYGKKCQKNGSNI